ncbi:Hypothetical predicted protein [Mytilus galloprovincialis]|uniref:Uncharacterized protein n=1 Tax=Mytilus galloprovincialis TaxID=29158 RepID=A0A8B6GFY4_MYTGA|nr:Hypothetical predicted protein [Mytilus galloprovincialis]
MEIDQEKHKADEWWNDLERTVLAVSEEVHTLSEDCGEVQAKCRVESVTFSVEQSPKLPRSCQWWEHLVLHCVHHCYLRKETFHILDGTVEHFTAVFEELDQYDLVFNNVEDNLFSTEIRRSIRLSGQKIWRGLFLRFQEANTLSKDCGEVKQRLESYETRQMFGTILEHKRVEIRR